MLYLKKTYSVTAYKCNDFVIKLTVKYYVLVETVMEL